MAKREHDPAGGIVGFFDDETLAVDEFFSPSIPARIRRLPKAKPKHYKVISISLYLDDIERLGELVAELKARGHTRASKSMLIREALRQIDLDKVPEQR